MRLTHSELSLTTGADHDRPGRAGCVRLGNMTQPGSSSARSFAERTLDEAGQLAIFLDAQRELLRASLDGMSEDEVRARLVPSRTTLLGLVKHATFMQVVWYQEAVTGTPRTELGQPQSVDDSFTVTTSDTIDSVRAEYDRACEVGRRLAATHDLDEVMTGHRMGAMTLRWIQFQVLRELAQHSGHADIIREQLIASRTPTPI